MSKRLLQVNELLKKELADMINTEIPLEDSLITLSEIKCSPDLKNASALITVIPSNKAGSALKLLRKNSKFFSAKLKKKLNLKFIPNFKWQIDSQERYANDLNEYISHLE